MSYWLLNPRLCNIFPSRIDLVKLQKHRQMLYYMFWVSLQKQKPCQECPRSKHIGWILLTMSHLLYSQPFPNYCNRFPIYSNRFYIYRPNNIVLWTFNSRWSLRTGDRNRISGLCPYSLFPISEWFIFPLPWKDQYSIGPIIRKALGRRGGDAVTPTVALGVDFAAALQRKQCRQCGWGRR